MDDFYKSYYWIHSLDRCWARGCYVGGGPPLRNRESLVDKYYIYIYYRDDVWLWIDVYGDFKYSYGLVYMGL